MIGCPLCKGTGKIPDPAFSFAKRQKESQDKSKIAKKLKKQGYTIREIMKMMGFKHPGSVSNLLK